MTSFVAARLELKLAQMAATVMKPTPPPAPAAAAAAANGTDTDATDARMRMLIRQNRAEKKRLSEQQQQFDPEG